MTKRVFAILGLFVMLLFSGVIYTLFHEGGHALLSGDHKVTGGNGISPPQKNGGKIEFALENGEAELYLYVQYPEDY